MKKIFIIISWALFSCNSGPPNPIPPEEFRKTFEADSRNNFQSFVPSKIELKEFEIALRSHLEVLTNTGHGFEQNVLDEVYPLEYSLGWFKRRYFGRIDENGARKIFAELVFVRCGGSDEWTTIDYPSDSNAECWWSAEFNVSSGKIEKINYPGNALPARN